MSKSEQKEPTLVISSDFFKNLDFRAISPQDRRLYAFLPFFTAVWTYRCRRLALSPTRHSRPPNDPTVYLAPLWPHLIQIPKLGRHQHAFDSR